MRSSPIQFDQPMPWPEWLSMWQAHGSLREFSSKIDRAKAIAVDGGSKGRLYGSISGGKDSVALAGICHESGIGMPWCHAHSWLNLPDTMSIVDCVAEKLNLALDVVEPEDDPESFLINAGQQSVMTESVMLDLANRFSAGELLRQYCYERNYDGHFDGRRADENKRTRGMLFRTKGPAWQSTVDKKWSVSPLAWWSSRDSFAFAVSRDLPIHPFYRRVAELGLNVERARVDWLFGPWLDPSHSSDDTSKAVMWAYPERWLDLVKIRPELASI